jgi:paraquat-inducible protein B
VSKKANPTIIGGFVVGAAILLSGAVAIFGGTELFAKRNVFDAYFDESTKGLRVGSNVMMNGVRIGYVSEIALLVDQDDFDTTTRVTLEILPDNFIPVRDGKVVREGMQTAIDYDQLIYEAGLRAQLEVEAIVTGQLLVNLAMRPETEATLRGSDSRNPEIPTIPSSVAQLLANIQGWLSEVRTDFDFDVIGDSLENILRGMDELINSPDVRESMSGINSLVNDPALASIATDLSLTLAELRTTIADAGSLFEAAEGDIASIRADLKPMLASLGSALDEAEAALQAAKLQLRGDSAQANQLVTTLEEIERAARAINNFFDYIERNPESLLRGKKE